MDTTIGQAERFVAEAGNAGVTRVIMDDFLATNPGRYDQLWQLYTGPSSIVANQPACMCFHEPCNCLGTSYPADTARPGTVPLGPPVELMEPLGPPVELMEPLGPPVSLMTPPAGGVSPVVWLLVAGVAVVLFWK